MDYERICSQEGYRREDLSPEDQVTLAHIDYVIEQIETLKDNLDLFDDDAGNEDTLVGKLKAELFRKAIDAAVDQARSAQLEIQIGLAERDA